MVPPIPPDPLPLLDQNLLAVEAKEPRLLVSIVAQFRGQPHVPIVSNHGRSSVPGGGFCCKVNCFQPRESGQEVNLVCVVSQYRPHSEQLAILAVGPNLFRPPKEGVEKVLSQERLSPPLLYEEGSNNLPMQRGKDTLV